MGPLPLSLNPSDDVHNLYCQCIFEKEEEEQGKHEGNDSVA